MVLNYLLVTAGACLFSIGFLCNKRFEQRAGSGFVPAMIFTMVSCLTIGISVLICTGFRIAFSWFSMFFAGLSALLNIAYIYCSVKSFTTANMSVYSVFAMLGGMLLPFFAGMLFFSEPVTWQKGACCILILAALFLSMKTGEKRGKGALLYYMAVFVLNGLNGVFSTIHQTNPDRIGTESYLMLSSFIAAGLCLMIIVIKERGNTFAVFGKMDKRMIGAMIGYGLTNGTGNLLVLFALIGLPASVQYPMITGGVMVFSTGIALLMREHVCRREFICVLLAFAGLIFAAI